MKRLRYSLLILGLAMLFLTTSYAEDADVDTLRASDVNADGFVNVLDLVLIAKYLGETSSEKQDPNPDVNADGTVNILDLVLVTQYLGVSIDPAIQRRSTYFVTAIPPGGSIYPHDSIRLHFDDIPRGLTVSRGRAVITGKIVTVSGPFTSGPLTLTVTWADGIQMLKYTVNPIDEDPPVITDATVKFGATDVDSEALNNDGRIVIIFSEEVAGNIALQTEDGDDVGWLGNVKGNKATLEIVNGKDLGDDMTYVIKAFLRDAAGNTAEIRYHFMTADIPFTLSENVIDHWGFDEGEGNIATNSIGAHDGEIFGSKWTFGKFGNALEFDGVDDTVVVKDYSTFDISENMTFMAWFRPTDTLTNRTFIVKHDSFYVSFGEQNQLKFGVHPHDISVESADTIGSRWYHFAVTFDAKTMRIYINGQLNSMLPNDVPMAPSEADLLIGQGFSGNIDEVRVYNKALSEDEIVDAYTGTDNF